MNHVILYLTKLFCGVFDYGKEDYCQDIGRLIWKPDSIRVLKRRDSKSIWLVPYSYDIHGSSTVEKIAMRMTFSAVVTLCFSLVIYDSSKTETI